MGKSVTPPPQPDFTSAAAAQGAANVDAAIASGKLSNPNITTPTTVQTVDYTIDPTTGKQIVPIVNQRFNTATPAGYNLDQALAYQAQTQNYLAQLESNQTIAIRDALGRIPTQAAGNIQTSVPSQAGNIWGGYDPRQSGYQAYGADVSNAGTVQLAPNLFGLGVSGQAKFAGPIQNSLTASQYGLAQGGPYSPYLNTSFNPGSQVQLSVNPAQQAQGSVAGPSLQQQLDLSGVGGVNQSLDPNRYGSAQGISPYALSPIQSQINTSGVPSMPITPGTTAQNAIMARLQPTLQQQRTQQETQLINQGLRPGDEAYDNAMRLFNQSQNDQLQQAALNGIGLDFQANQQAFGQAAQQGSFANQAQQQLFGEGLSASQAQNQALAQNYGMGAQAQQQNNAAQNQAFQEAVARGDFGNQAQLALFGANMQNANLYNQAGQQNFNNSLAAGNFGNQAQQQLYGENQGLASFANQAAAQQFGLGQQATQAQNQAVAQNFGQGLAAQNAYNAAQQQWQQEAIDLQNQQNTANTQNWQAALQQQAAANATNQQVFQQDLALQQQRNDANRQNYANILDYVNANNQGQAQIFNQNLAAANFANAAQQQQLGQQIQLQSLPINEIAALMGTGQVNNPQFQAYQGQNVQAGNYQAAAQQQAQWQQQLYQQQVASRNSMMGGLFSLGGALAGLCWIAEALYGVKDWRTWVMRWYVNGPMQKTLAGKILARIYRRYGERVAAYISDKPETFAPRRALRALFDFGLNIALRQLGRNNAAVLARS